MRIYFAIPSFLASIPTQLQRIDPTPNCMQLPPVIPTISIVLAVPETNITSAIRLGVVLRDKRNLKVFLAYYSSNVWYP
jgi:hypothetical protein